MRGHTCIEYFDLYQVPSRLDEIMEEGLANIDKIFDQCISDLNRLQYESLSGLTFRYNLPGLLCISDDMSEIIQYSYYFAGNIGFNDEARECFREELGIDKLEAKVETLSIWECFKKALQRW